MKKKFTLFALALLSVVAFAYQTTRASGDPTVLYSWESPDGTIVETGGTATYENGNDPSRLNYSQKGYYTMCLNGKKANIGDTEASANAGHMLITLNEELKEGDEIAITAFTNKTSASKSSAYVVFEKGDAIDSGDYTDESNLGLEPAGAPITKTITVAAGNAGSKTIKLTRGSTGTNLFITKLVISRAASSEEPIEEPSTEDAVTVDFTDNGYENGDEVTTVEENDITVAFDKGTNSNTPKWYDSGQAIRLYGGGSMTVSADKNIKKIVITFGSGDGSNEITADVGTYADGVWEGESKEVVFSVGGTKGHRRIAKLTVTLADDEPIAELEVPGTVIWSSDEAADIDWSVGKSVIIPAENFADVKVGDKINIGILGAPADASSSNWNYQVALQVPTTDGWKNIESGETLKQKDNYVHSFIITGDMLRYLKQYGLALNGTKFQVKKVAVESAYSGSDESIWIGELKGNVTINSCHFTNANDFTGVQVGDIIRVTKDAVSWVGLNYNDKGYTWSNFPEGSITVANDWVNPTVEFTIATEEAANLINTGSASVVVNNPEATITQIELIKAPVVEPEVVEIIVEPADGTDIYEAYAAKVKEVTDAGNVVGKITIRLADNASYTISKTIIANKDISIVGDNTTIDASGLEGNMIEMATLDNPTEWTEVELLLLDITVKGLKKSLFFSNSKNYAFTRFDIQDCLIEQAGDATTIDFTKGSTALYTQIWNSTFYAPTATTKAFYSSQGGQKATEYKSDATQTFDIAYNTMYNLAPGKNFFSHRQSNQTWLKYIISKNIFVNCGKSGQVIKGMNGGQSGKNPSWDIFGNLFNFEGADTSASEETGDEAEPVQDSVEGIITFIDPTAPDFSGTVLLSPSATEPTFKLGDHRWTLTYGKALAINITDSEGGKVTASPSAAAEGMTVTLTATPDEGYELESLTVKDGADAEVTVGEDNTFTMPATDVTVTATFKKLPVDVNITVESGNDIAAAVEAAADGAPIKSITVTLAENGEYTIGKTLTSPGNVTINGAEGATIDASGLAAPLITLNGGTTFAPKADGSDSDHILVESVTIKDVTIKGLKDALVKDAQKSLVENVTIENSVVEMPASNKNVLDFNGKGYAGKVTVKNSTIWSAGKNTGFFAQYGSRPKNVNGDLLQEFDVQNSTIVNIANGKNFCDLKQNGTAQNVYTIKNSIFADCGKAGQVVVGFNKGQTSATPVWDVDGNTFIVNGADNSEAEISKAGQKAGEDIVKNCLTSDPEFADAANGDFTVGESTEQAELETGDPRWLVEFVGGEGDATNLLAEIEEAKKLLKYSMPYYDENNEESPETEGKALVDAIRDAEEKAEGGTSQKKLDKMLEELKQAEIDYTTALMDYELAESEAILAGADPADELAAEIQRLYDTQDVVREDYSNQPKHIKNYADEIDKAQKAYLRKAINELIPEAQAMASDPAVQNALDKANEALEGDSSEDLFDALNGLLEAMETATGIRGIEASETDDAPVYNMGGQRVSSHAKGIVIKNGKKIIRK